MGQALSTNATSAATARNDAVAIAEAGKKVDQLITENTIAIFSKTTCGYCARAKKALSERKQTYKSVELDEVDDGEAIQEYLLEKTKQWTVPNVFINQKHVGGCDDLLRKLKSGEIKFQ
ncbi:glutaredoxin [Ramicandelaber brevisporus]|nr:glutaredoxin [Ramicandelaber brevisporus]